MAQILKPTDEIVLDHEDEKILDRVWERFRQRHPNFRSSPKEQERLRTLEQRRAALYAGIPSLEERLRRGAEMRRRAGVR